MSMRRAALTPAPEDPLATVEGALAKEFGGLDTGELRQRAREDDAEATDRRHLP
jgi:hypothetical protein